VKFLGKNPGPFFDVVERVGDVTFPDPQGFEDPVSPTLVVGVEAAAAERISMTHEDARDMEGVDGEIKLGLKVPHLPGHGQEP
jgi:hypothetical protein